MRQSQPARAAVRTVLGDIPAAELGVCDAHDHLFFRSPQLPGQELDDPEAATQELCAFRELGGQAVVQWSPFGTARRTDALPQVSRDAGVHIVAATGLHQAAHCAPGVLERVTHRLAELFVAELTEGVRRDEDPDGPAEPVRAGLIKVAGVPRAGRARPAGDDGRRRGTPRDRRADRRSP